MKLVEVLIEYKAQSLNHPFSYLYDLNKEIQVGERVIVSFNNRDVVGYVLSVNDASKSKEEIEKEIGFKILQFNAVVASNSAALNLYKNLGFTQLGTIPGGFKNKNGDYEDIIPHYIVL